MGWGEAGAGAMTGAQVGSSFGPWGTVIGGVGGAIMGAFSGNSKKKEQYDPLAGLRAQLQGLAANIPGQVAKQKELSAARYKEAGVTGKQNIAEDVRGTRGFGSSSIESRLQTELADKLAKSQSESDLASDIWGNQAQASILQGTAGMYPPELTEEPSWQSQLLGTGAQMAVQNWQEDQQWKRIANMFGTKGGGGTTGGGGSSQPYDWGNTGSNFGTQYLKF